MGTFSRAGAQPGKGLSPAEQNHDSRVTTALIYCSLTPRKAGLYTGDTDRLVKPVRHVLW